MGVLLGKAFFAVVLWAVAANFWQTLRGWARAGEIPAGVEDAEALMTEGTPAFRGTIAWYKFLALMMIGFAVLTTGSLLFDCVRLV